MPQPPSARHGALLTTYLRPQRASVALLAVLLVASIAFQIAGPQVLGRFIDVATGAAGSAGTDLRQVALLFIAVALAGQVATVLATWLGEYVGWTATNDLRADLTQHCLGLDLTFHKDRTPGELIERIDGDVTALATFFSQLVIQVLGNILLAVGILVVLWRTDPITGGALTLFALAILATMAVLRRIPVPGWAAARQASADLFGFLEERLAGTEDIRAAGARSYVMGRLHDLLRRRLDTERAARLKGMLVWVLPLVLFAGGNAIAFLIAAVRHHAGLMTLGTAFVVYYYTRLLFQPLIQLSNQVQDFQKATAGIGRIGALFATRSALADPAPGTASVLPPGPLAVEFDAVDFGYGATGDDEQGQLVIGDLTFRLEPGEVLGLLGRTGSGKTTISRLLCRLYDPTDGAIRLGGADLRALRRADLRRRVGLVTQDVQLFRATVRDNLAFFDRTIPDTRIWAALAELGLTGWVDSLPDGLDTVLSGGGGLSAGEAQLLAFGRVFLRDPGLVILDEASSRLDPATEALIERAIDRLLRGRTAIVIAHRLATVARADSLLILEDGRVCEHGDRVRLAADPASRFHALLRAGAEEVRA